jgi:hypothetical protein
VGQGNEQHPTEWLAEWMHRRFFAGTVCIPAHLRQLGADAAGEPVRTAGQTGHVCICILVS